VVPVLVREVLVGTVYGSVQAEPHVVPVNLREVLMAQCQCRCGATEARPRHARHQEARGAFARTARALSSPGGIMVGGIVAVIPRRLLPLRYRMLRDPPPRNDVSRGAKDGLMEM
jgi:hypothetical protein